MIDHDVTQLWVVRQVYTPTDTDEVLETIQVQCGKYIRKGRLYFPHRKHIYNASGQTLK